VKARLQAFQCCFHFKNRGEIITIFQGTKLSCYFIHSIWKGVGLRGIKENLFFHSTIIPLKLKSHILFCRREGIVSEVLLNVFKLGSKFTLMQDHGSFDRARQFDFLEFFRIISNGDRLDEFEQYSTEAYGGITR